MSKLLKTVHTIRYRIYAKLFLLLLISSACQIKERLIRFWLDSQIVKTYEYDKLQIHILEEIENEDSLISHFHSAFEETNSFLANKLKNVTLYVDFSEGCNAYTLVDYDIIVLNVSNDCIGPFVHELMHVHFGLYHEFWFQEGFATFLSRRIKSHSSREMSVDSNDLWFEDYSEYDLWFRDYSDNDSLLCPVKTIFKAYTKDKIKSIFNIRISPDFRNLRDEVNYYRLSGAFCEYMVAEIGLAELISLSQAGEFNERSIVSSTRENGINIDEIYDRWLEVNVKKL